MAMGMIDHQQRASGNHYCARTAFLAKREDANVIKHIKKDITSFVDRIKAQNVSRVQYSLTEVGKIRPADDRHGDDEADHSAGFHETKSLLQKERVEIHVAVRDRRREISQDFLGRLQHASVGRI